MSSLPIQWTALVCLLLIGCAGDDTMDPVDLPNLSIEPLSVTEGDDEKVIYVRLMMDQATPDTVTAFLQTSEGTAEADSDFKTVDYFPVQFLPGDLVREAPVTIIGDKDFEPNETFEVLIANVFGANTGTASATITIENDDPNTELYIPETGFTSPESYPGMELIWQDEFSGTELDPNFWTFEIGTGNNGWGNNESQYYREENTYLTQGNLVIEAKRETFGGRNFTSSRIITQDKFDFQYGRVDIRAALPYSQGIWPALWMLGSNFSSVGWPACGEIDIMELVGHEPDVVHGTVHWSNAGSHAEFGGSTSLSEGIFYDEFHVFSIIWDAQSITWLLDDVPYHTISTTPAELSEFQAPFFFIFNVAVGGNWPGYPDSSTVFPQRMIVDYVRVFQEE